MSGGDGEEVRPVWAHWGTPGETAGTGTNPTGGRGVGGVVIVGHTCSLVCSLQQGVGFGMYIYIKI